MRAFPTSLLLVLSLLLLLACPAYGCEDDGDCPGEDECVNGQCAPIACMRSELKDFNTQFDAAKYTEMLMREADVTKELLLATRREFKDDDAGFIQSPPVQRFTKVIQSRSQELNQIANIMESCESGAVTKELVLEDTAGLDTAKAEGRGVGLLVGYLLAVITGLLSPAEEDEDAGNTTDAFSEEFFVSDTTEVEASTEPQDRSVGLLAGYLLAVITSLLTLPEEEVDAGNATAALTEEFVAGEIAALDETANERSVGLFFGYIFAVIGGLLGPEGDEDDIRSGGEQSSPTVSPSMSARPSMSPSIFPSGMPSVAPSNSPTFPVAPKLYLGFHLEGGFLFDGSYSLLFPSENTTNTPNETPMYSRGCIGAELGAGGEVSLIIMSANLRENNDIVGTSVLAEFFEFGLGPAVGFGVGLFLDGDATRDGNEALAFEVSLGLGLQFGLVGSSICRTNVYSTP